MSSSQSLRAEYEQRERDLLQDLDLLVSLLSAEHEDSLARSFSTCLQDLQEMVTHNRPRSDKVFVGVSLRSPFRGGMGSPINDRFFPDPILLLFKRVADNAWLYQEACYQGLD